MALSTMMAYYWKMLSILANVPMENGLSECTAPDLELGSEGCVCVCSLRNSYPRGGRYFGPRLQVKRLQAAAGRYGGGASA